jgi:tetratricopeptide (TPR) repeat protein
MSGGERASFAARDGVFLAALFVAVFLVYQPAWNGGFLWDDSAHVTAAELRSWRGLWRIWFEVGATQQYYPLSHSAFWIQHRLWGDAPAGYHLVSIALHFAAAALAAVILRNLAVPGAYLAAAVFALHPVHVESVAWISELKNTLSAVFYLAGALAYLRFDERGGRARYGVALALFVLALCSKTVTASLPAALLVIAWWRRGRVTWQRDVLPLLPFFVLGACAGLLTVWVERKFTGAEGPEFDLTLAERVLVAGRAIWFYLAKLFWPVNLTFIYPRWRVSQAALSQYIFLVAAICSFGAAWLARKRTRGPLAASLFFVGTLFPALGFLNVYPFRFSFVADHFQYLASLGIIAFAIAAGTRLLARLHGAPQPAAIASCALLLPLALVTWNQSQLYADAETLYRATVRNNPECWMAWNNLAHSLIKRGELDEGERFARKALELRPHYAEAHDNLALALAGRGNMDEAIPHFEAALELRPDFAEAHNALGLLLASRGRIREAFAHFEAAIDIDASYAEAHNNLAILLVRSGRVDEAIAHFRAAVALEPAREELQKNLAAALANRGKVQ